MYPKKHHQVEVTVIMMFLKKVWTLQAVEVFFFFLIFILFYFILFIYLFFDCLRKLGSKVNEIFENTNTLKENQIKVEKQFTDLAEKVNILSEKFDEFEADRKLKEEIIKCFRGQVSVPHDDLKKWKHKGTNRHNILPKIVFFFMGKKKKKVKIPTAVSLIR